MNVREARQCVRVKAGYCISRACGAVPLLQNRGLRTGETLEVCAVDERADSGFQNERLCGAGVLRGLRSRSGFTSVEVFRKYLVSHDSGLAVCSPQYLIGLSLLSCLFQAPCTVFIVPD